MGLVPQWLRTTLSTLRGHLLPKRPELPATRFPRELLTLSTEEREMLIICHQARNIELSHSLLKANAHHESFDMFAALRRLERRGLVLVQDKEQEADRQWVLPQRGSRLAAAAYLHLQETLAARAALFAELRAGDKEEPPIGPNGV